MRWLVAATLLVTACSRERSPEPAWPKSAGWETPDTWEDDGGESLEPRADHLSAVEESEPEVLPEEPEPAAPDVMIEAEPEVPSSSDAAPSDATPDGAIIIEAEPPPDSSASP